MSILIEKGGLLSTIQDSGRTGFRRFGINPNGAMDKTAARLINILLGNDEREAIFEMHFPAPKILFEQAAIIALGGANFGSMLDGESIENWRPYFIKKNQTLNFTEKISGNRVYLAFKGGFRIDEWLGSASTNLTAKIGGYEGRSLAKDDRLFFKAKGKRQKAKFPYCVSKSLISRYNSFPTVRVVAGAEFERLTALSEQNFLKQTFAITGDSNRMGFRLKGEPLYLLDKIELVSSAVDFGTIQLLPDGQMIILMADAQTSGGYPRIAHIVSADLPLVGQLGAGDKIGFEIVSVQDAEDLTIEFENDLNRLWLGCYFKQTSPTIISK